MTTIGAELQSTQALPEGWTLASMKEIGVWKTGGTPSRKVDEYFGGTIPWIKSGDLNDGVLIRAEERITEAGLAASAAKVLPNGAVIVALYGATIGRLAILGCKAATNQACAACIPNPAIDRRFLFYQLLWARKQLIAAGQGGAQPNISNQIVRDWPCYLPPLAEQRRIVEKVEALLARAEAARERLRIGQGKITRFQDILAVAASSGALLGANEQKSTVRLLDVLSEPLANGRSVVDDPRGFPVLRLNAITSRGIDLSQRKLGAWTAQQAKPFLIQNGDFLVVRGNGSLKLVGRGALVDSTPDAVAYPDTLIRVRTNPKKLDSRYLAIVWNSEEIRQQIESTARTTAGIHKISQRDLEALEIPVFPLSVQKRIVAVHRKLGVLDEIVEKRVRAVALVVEKLRSAILAKAFAGELVPTEAELARREKRAYEPASVSLERAQQKSLSQGGAKKPRVRRR